MSVSTHDINKNYIYNNYTNASQKHWLILNNSYWQTRRLFYVDEILYNQMRDNCVGMLKNSAALIDDIKVVYLQRI